MTRDLVTTWREKHTDEWIIKALDMSRGKNQKYTDAILINWEANGYPPTREEKVKNARSNHQSNRVPVPAQSDYTAEELAAEIAAARAWKQQQGQYVNV
jgi:DNA replication protein DnaD